MTTVFEAVTIDGVEFYHTFRGHNEAVEVYTYQADNVTFNLYKPANDRHWHCDWVTSYHQEAIPLPGDTENTGSMLRAFAAILKERNVA